MTIVYIYLNKDVVRDKESSQKIFKRNLNFALEMTDMMLVRMRRVHCTVQNKIMY